MNRNKKDGKFFTVYLDRSIFNRLKKYADAKGQTRTMALERILQKHFAKNVASKEEKLKLF